MSDSDDEEKNSMKISFSKGGKSEGQVAKMKVIMDVDEANELWKDSIQKLKNHIHQKRIQAAALESDKNNLARDEMLVHCGFSQSYQNSE